MNQLPLDRRALILSMLCEGASMRSTARITGCSINTITKLLVDAGRACLEYHDRNVRGVRSRYVQCDEIWAFCYAKQKNAGRVTGAQDHAGDVWTWTGIDADTKLVVSWHVGGRDAGSAREFVRDLRVRIANRVQLSTDGHSAYLEAVERAFGADADYAQLVKLYGESPDDPRGRRVIGSEKVAVAGAPDLDTISTSFVERQNLTMRMSMRRYTRRTNAHSKKLLNHVYANAVYFVWYNFARVHSSLKATPAMAAGLAEYPRDARWIVGLADGLAKAN